MGLKSHVLFNNKHSMNTFSFEEIKKLKGKKLIDAFKEARDYLDSQPKELQGLVTDSIVSSYFGNDVYRTIIDSVRIFEEQKENFMKESNNEITRM